MKADYRVIFSVPNTGVMNIPVEVCERHLTEEMTYPKAMVQAVGRETRITVWSERDNIELTVPHRTWYVDKAMWRSVTSHSINVARWADKFAGHLSDGERQIPVQVQTISDLWQYPK